MRSKAMETAMGLIQAREIGESIARAIAPPPVEPPKPEAPYYWEDSLPAGTRDLELKLGIRARYLHVRTDRDISVKIDMPGWAAIPVMAAESPFKMALPPNLYTSRVFITALAGGTVKVIAAVSPIDISFGRAKLEGTGIQSFSVGQTYWYYAVSAILDAVSHTTYVAAVDAGVPYVVPDNKRLVMDLVTLSTDVKGAVQQVDLLEYKADGTFYRFGGAYFDCVVPLHLRVPLAAGSSFAFTFWNWDSDARTIWMVANGWEEWL